MAVDVTSGSIDAAPRVATVRWSGVDDPPGLTGSMDARRDRRMTIARAVRDGAVVAGLIFLGFLFVVIAPSVRTFGFDAFAYWAVDIADPYQAGVGGLGAFNYSPPIARLFDPFGALEWPTFVWIWSALLIGNLVWLGGRSVRVLWLLALPPVALELYHGNVHLWIASAIVLGFRYPWTWAFVILTKVTPGIGLVWFAVRREWRSLGIALGVTGAIVAVSILFDGRLWSEWIAFLATTPEGGSVAQPQIGVPLWLRLPVALAVVVWGALTDRRWTVPLAAALALPVMWISGFAICAACLPLARRGSIGRSGGDTVRSLPFDSSAIA
jgi:Glycosyltransferase family 87